MDSSRFDDQDKFGEVLASELVTQREEKKLLLQGVTLCNDGAKWRKRSLINSKLMTSAGPFFAKSTEATGYFKDAKYLLDDIIENIFTVALDGACKSTL